MQGFDDRFQAESDPRSAVQLCHKSYVVDLNTDDPRHLSSIPNFLSRDGLKRQTLVVQNDGAVECFFL
jgi:hypothetical protein